MYTMTQNNSQNNVGACLLASMFIERVLAENGMYPKNKFSMPLPEKYRHEVRHWMKPKGSLEFLGGGLLSLTGSTYLPLLHTCSGSLLNLARDGHLQSHGAFDFLAYLKKYWRRKLIFDIR
jgi:hypothetical protein